MQRMGRRTLLALSAAGAISSLLAVGFGLDSGAVTVASLAVMTFIAYVYSLSTRDLPLY